MGVRRVNPNYWSATAIPSRRLSMKLNARVGASGRKDSRTRWLQKLDRDPGNNLVLQFLEITTVLNPKVMVIADVRLW
jgi:hypothetical protein